MRKNKYCIFIIMKREKRLTKIKVVRKQGGDKLNTERLFNKCSDKEVQPFFFYNALIKKGSVFKILNCLTVKFSINSGGI